MFISIGGIEMCIRDRDTGHIQLPKESEYLVEEMAKNVHEVWSKTRIEQGLSLIHI